MAEKTLKGLLNNITGSDYPNPVAGFIPDQSGMNNQMAFDKLTGAADQYVKSRNDGSGTATTLLRMLQGSKAAGLNTQNIYLNALKGQQQLTKGMLDVQKIQAELTKLGFTNAKLARLDKTTQRIILDALLKGDYDKVQKISLLGGEKYGERLYPEPDKVPYDVTQFKQLIKNLPELQQNKLILEYVNAVSPKDKSDIQEKVLQMQAKLPELSKKINIPKSALDVVNNLENIPQQNIQNSNQSSQYIPPMEVGIPSTNLNKSPDVANYQLGDYNTAVNNNQQQKQNQPVGLEQNQPETKTTISENFVTNTLGKTFSLNDITIPTKPDDNGLVGKRAPNETVLQGWADDKPNQTRIAKIAINDMNELSRDIDALLHSKGFEEYFSRGGAIIGELSSDAIATRTLYNRIISSTALGRLVKMKLDSPNGATPFGQLNYSELMMVKEDITETQVGGNSEYARTGLSTLVNALNRDAQESLMYYDTIYGKNSSKDFNYIYSPNVDLGGGTIENAISGYNLRYQLGDRAAGIKDQYFYIPNQESGEWEFINNPKTGKPLINQDYKNRNY